MFKLNDQTKADLVKAWDTTKPMLKKLGGIILRGFLLCAAVLFTVILICYSMLLALVWVGLCGAAGVFYLNYKDAVYEREQMAKHEARRQKMGW